MNWVIRVLMFLFTIDRFVKADTVHSFPFFPPMKSPHPVLSAADRAHCVGEGTNSCARLSGSPFSARNFLFAKHLCTFSSCECFRTRLFSCLVLGYEDTNIFMYTTEPHKSVAISRQHPTYNCSNSCVLCLSNEWASLPTGFWVSKKNYSILSHVFLVGFFEGAPVKLDTKKWI